MKVQTMDKLKPCPFCGGEVSASCERKVNYLYVMSMPAFAIECRVGCEKCGIYFRQNSVISRAEYRAPVTNRDRYEEAVEAWNRRSKKT